MSVDNPQSLEEAVTEMHLLAHKLLNCYKHVPHPRDDLYQEAMIGVIIAYNKFDPSKKCAFSTYAQFWMRAQVVQHIRKNLKFASDEQLVDVHEHQENYDLVIDFDNFINQLPEMEHQAITRLRSEGHTFREIKEKYNFRSVSYTHAVYKSVTKKFKKMLD